MLAEYEGRWVAVDKQGRVVAHAPTLADVMRETGNTARRLTFLYAAPGAAPAAAVRS
jgi:hypothetical protein